MPFVPLTTVVQHNTLFWRRSPDLAKVQPCVAHASECGCNHWPAWYRVCWMNTPLHRQGGFHFRVFPERESCCYSSIRRRVDRCGNAYDTHSIPIVRYMCTRFTPSAFISSDHRTWTPTSFTKSGTKLRRWNRNPWKRRGKNGSVYSEPSIDSATRVAFRQHRTPQIEALEGFVRCSSNAHFRSK